MILSPEYLTFLLVCVYYAIHKYICYFEVTNFFQSAFSIISCVLLYIGISISMATLLTEEDSKHIKIF